MKKLGNDSLRNGDNYDALWKYEHALQVYDSHPSLKPVSATVHSKIAAVCINLGDHASGCEDLMDPQQYSQTVAPDTIYISSQVRWYIFAQQHTFEAISVSTVIKSKTLHQVGRLCVGDIIHQIIGF